MRSAPGHDFHAEPPRRRKSGWRNPLTTAVFLFVAVFIAALGTGAFLLTKFTGAKNPLELIKTGRMLMDPRQAFPGQDRITVLCLGLDRNIFTNHKDKSDPRNGMPYTKGSRSDVMMVASLDLQNQAVSILSIPRDTRVILPGKTRYAKINQAHADGGVEYTKETVEEFLGCKIDHYVVIKQEAIQNVVDALGGVNVKVPHDMDYDDNWGNLHVHLKEGEQLLNGEQAVGFMRFRHDREGDFGRIKRQQQVIQILGQDAKNPMVITKAPGLIDAIRKYINTDLSPDQQLALAKLFNKMDPGHIQTAQLPVLDTETLGGVSYVIPDDDRKEAAVDWIIHGNPDAMNRMVRVELLNASGDVELYGKVYDCLRHYGFTVVRAGRAKSRLETSHAVQHSSLKGAARQVLKVLNVPGTVEKGEDAVTDVTLYVGKDLERSQTLASADMWPPIPERHRPTEVQVVDRRASRRSRRREETPLVNIRPANGEPEAQEEAPVSIPGSPEPRRHEGDSAPAPQPAPPAAPAPDAGGSSGKTVPAEPATGA